MPIYTIEESIALLDEGKCGSCAAPLTRKSMRDRIGVGPGVDAYIERGEHAFCEQCSTYWTEDAISERRREAERVQNLRS